MNRIRPLLGLLIVLPLIACAKAAERPIDTASVAASSSTPTLAPESTPIAEWVVTEHGIGKLRAGMTVAEARVLFPSFKLPQGADTTGCDYATIDGLPLGVHVMVDGGKVGRVDVDSGAVTTSTGARIGDSEDRIKSLYPNRVTVSPHEYTDGHYLTVGSGSETDSLYRIIFETDGKRVLNYRAGTRPSVEYVEGCS
jgi:hypothetical protein